MSIPLTHWYPSFCAQIEAVRTCHDSRVDERAALLGGFIDGLCLARVVTCVEALRLLDVVSNARLYALREQAARRAHQVSAFGRLS